IPVEKELKKGTGSFTAMAEQEGTDKPLLNEQPVAPSASQSVTSQDDAIVETAEEAVEPPEADINELCRDMFSKMALYLTGELTATSEDYKLLENMNKLTCLKYMEMKDIAGNISRNLKDLNKKYASLQPYLEQINQIEEQVASLENAAYKLDAYSKRLAVWQCNSLHPQLTAKDLQVGQSRIIYLTHPQASCIAKGTCYPISSSDRQERVRVLGVAGNNNNWGCWELQNSKNGLVMRQDKLIANRNAQYINVTVQQTSASAAGTRQLCGTQEDFFSAIDAVWVTDSSISR
ncbi:hypothetical protein XELAEV_18036998mg, partial [Xenopus laevis]